MKQKIKNLIRDIKLINFEFGGKVSQMQVDGMVEQAIFDLCREACEQQKVVCAKAYDMFDEDTISILNSKNICDG